MDRHRPALSRRASLLLAVPPLAFIALFFVWPIIGILRLGLAADEEPLGAIARVWTDEAVVDVVLFTVGLAIVSTVVWLPILTRWPMRFDSRTSTPCPVAKSSPISLPA